MSDRDANEDEGTKLPLWMRAVLWFRRTTEPAQPDRDGKVAWHQSNGFAFAVLALGVVALGVGLSIVR